MAETEQALQIARRIPFGVLVTHMGLPRSQNPAPDNSRDAARRSLDELQELAEPLGVRVAVEVIPNELSRAGSLVHFVEADLEGPRGMCLDFGHAHMDGDWWTRSRACPGTSSRRTCTTTGAAPTSIWSRSKARSTGRRR